MIYEERIGSYNLTLKGDCEGILKILKHNDSKEVEETDVTHTITFADGEKNSTTNNYPEEVNKELARAARNANTPIS